MVSISGLDNKSSTIWCCFCSTAKPRTVFLLNNWNQISWKKHNNQNSIRILNRKCNKKIEKYKMIVEYKFTSISFLDNKIFIIFRFPFSTAVNNGVL